jgi:hypothetical protein
MRRLLGFLIFALLIAWSCSKKGSEPDDSNGGDILTQDINEFQASNGKLLDSLLSSLDTATAKNRVLNSILKNDSLVEWARVNSQGISIKYRGGRVGGIMIDPEDMAEGPDLSGHKIKRQPQTSLYARNIPNSSKTVFLCPIYSERKSYADTIIESANINLQNAGYDELYLHLDDSCGLERFTRIDGYGLIHIYTHSLAWPAKESVENVFVMTADTATEGLDERFSEELKQGTIGVFYVPGRGNTYFIDATFFTANNDFGQEQSLVYLSFGFGFLAKWQDAVRLGSKAGVCIGYNWRVFASKNRDWACEFYETMADTSAIKHYTVKEWHESINNSYVDELESTPPLPRLTQIQYYGVSDFSLWMAFRLISITPSAGRSGTSVELRGFGFGPDQLENYVTFGGIEADIDMWSDTLIVTSVPAGAATGEVIVTASGAQSNPVEFQVFEVRDVVPTSGVYGDTAAIHGTGFGQTQNSGSVKFSEIEAEIVSWSDTIVVFVVPDSTVTTYITVMKDGVEGNAVLFRVFGIRSIAPGRSVPGHTVKITGSEFGYHPGTSQVLFGDVAAGQTSWSSTVIDAVVPNEAISGYVVVTNGTLRTNGYYFRITRATGIIPNWGPEESVVKILGEELSATNGYVHFSGVSEPAEILSWTNDQVEAIVPSGVQSGGVYVEADGIRTVDLDFQVFRIDELSPDKGYVGDTISIIGENFLEYKITDSIMFGDTPGTIIYWSDTLVRAEVPECHPFADVVLHVKGIQSNGISFDLLTSSIIDNIDPDWGTYGTRVTLTGSGFGATQGLRRVRFNGVGAPISYWSDRTIVTEFPYNCTAGDAVVEGYGRQSNPVPFSVVGITGVAPEWTFAGDTIVISGTGFGDQQGSGEVIVSEVDALVVSWSNTVIEVEVPEEAPSGALAVLVNDTQSNTVYIDIKTGSIIRSIDPDWGPLGSRVTIFGRELGDTPGSLLFSGSESSANVLSWSDTEIEVEVPEWARSGWVRAETAGALTNELYFNVFRVDEVMPNEGVIGDTVSIYGEGFLHHSETDSVLFSNIPAPVVHWSDTHIRAAVPDSASTGQIRLHVNGSQSNSVSFTVTAPPIINSIDPNHGTYGDQVTITGSGFRDPQSGGIVIFSGREAPVSSWSDSLILTEFPTGCARGDVNVEVGGRASNLVPFSVFGISSVYPPAAFVGDEVIVYGSGFGNSQGSNYLEIGDSLVEATAWYDSFIKFQVAENTPSGYVTVAIDGKQSNSIGLAVGALAIARKANHVEVSFNGIMETSAGTGFRQFDMFMSKEDTHEWDFNSFYTFREEIRWYDVTQRIYGEIDLSGDKTGDVDCRSRYLEEAAFVQNTIEITYEYVLSEVPLTDAVIQDSTTVEFRLTGPEVQDHIRDVRCYERNRQGEMDTWEYSWRYLRADWDNVESPPEIRLTFRRE